MSKQEETQSRVRVFALGGLGETGKNMYVVEVDEEMIVLDAGQMIPQDDMLGIDVVIPDISYLVQHKDRVKAIVLSHGHEDHTGALAYIIDKLQVPVYGSKLTIGLIEDDLKAKNPSDKTKLKVVSPGGNMKAGKIRVEFFRVNHSIPDCLGIAIQTPQGYVVYTGDFKIDQTPPDRKFSDIGRMTDYGKKKAYSYCFQIVRMLKCRVQHRLRKTQKQELRACSVKQKDASLLVRILQMCIVFSKSSMRQMKQSVSLRSLEIQ